MALIKLGGLAQDVRGSQNGLTFSRNKGGAYVRAKVSPVQPRTAAQLTVRGNLSQSAKDWSGALTVLERNSWAGFAASNTRTNVFGDTTHLSGLQWFVGLNQVLKQIGATTITAPPADLGVPANRLVSGFLALDPDNVVFTVEPGTVEPGVGFYVFMTPPLAPGKVPSKNLYRFLAYQTIGTSSVAGQLDLSNQYKALFGDPIIGKKVSAIISNVNNLTGATTVGAKFDGIAPIP